MTQDRFKDRPVWKAFLNIGQNVEQFFAPEGAPVKTGFMSKLFGLSK